MFREDFQQTRSKRRFWLDEEARPRAPIKNRRLEGGNHSIWMSPQTGATEAVPRHNEIKEPLAKRILKRLSAG